MPIGDLLAQISGGDGPASAPAPGLSRSNTLPKRKADEDLRLNTYKAPRTTTLSSTVAPRSEAGRPHRSVETSAPPSRFSQPSRPLDRPSPSQRPTNGTNARPSVLSARPLNGSNRVQKSVPPSRPSPGPSNAPLPSRAAPKKGSFAEILARGQRAQAVMGQVGKIQHKKVEKGAAAPTPKKEKDEPRMDPRAANSKKLPQRPSGYSGTAKPGQRNGMAANGGHRDGRNGKAALTKAEIAKSVAEEEREKKFKKAAAATTGYTGTARPKPGNSSKKHDTPRGGALLSRAPRPTTSKSRLDDGYDEDMDDFIDYDDEEEDDLGGPRYDYNSDASSDMEAGLDDIDGEERRAEYIARREDIEEERLERSLKAAKEDRKRKALEALRGGRRR